MPPRCNARIFWAGVCPCSQGIGSGMRAMRIWRLETPHVGALIRAFCDAETPYQKSKEFNRIVDAAKIADKLKLEVHAGHGICYNTIKAFKGLDEIDEFSIGHSIIARSILTGIEQAVRDMKELILQL